jgi:alpha/beta hydrolase fold
VITVDYRLAPEHPYPTAVEDAVKAYRWVRGAGAQQFNLDVERIAVGGNEHSALKESNHVFMLTLFKALLQEVIFLWLFVSKRLKTLAPRFASNSWLYPSSTTQRLWREFGHRIKMHLG